jgi:hypothetical protein
MISDTYFEIDTSSNSNMQEFRRMIEEIEREQFNEKNRIRPTALTPPTPQETLSALEQLREELNGN